ncbi:nitroreductase family protein [Planococcus faecalis]|uniref:Nitroreductase family protein n=1 Tax=Planococcus faecalis TaxID=1598147 RepID=A0ABM6IV18_9BACL|nr:nitroreductase family protein [Planococcus faecalis]AQU80197.1 nitroreductase family protein [Planococcus faecalis]
MQTTQTYQKTNDFNDILSNRRSIKQYDPSVKISREEMSQIIEQASTAPSSINMQPWRFVVIDSEEGKAKIAPLASFNLDKVMSSSAVIAIFADRKNIEYAEDIYGKAVELGYMPEEVKQAQLDYFKPAYENAPDDQMKDIIMLDAGLVSMQLMLVARAHGYGTNPIGGYDKENIAEALDMDKDRYVPVMLITIGKALNEGFPSYRLPVDTTTQWK